MDWFLRQCTLNQCPLLRIAVWRTSYKSSDPSSCVSRDNQHCSLCSCSSNQIRNPDVPEPHSMLKPLDACYLDRLWYYHQWIYCVTEWTKTVLHCLEQPFQKFTFIQRPPIPLSFGVILHLPSKFPVGQVLNLIRSLEMNVQTSISDNGQNGIMLIPIFSTQDLDTNSIPTFVFPL